MTGGTRGVGRAIAKRFLRERAAVAICGRTAASVERAVQELASACAGKVRDIETGDAIQCRGEIRDQVWPSGWSNRKIEIPAILRVEIARKNRFGEPFLLIVEGAD